VTAVSQTTNPAAAREVYREVLLDLAMRDERVVCLDSDTGLFSGASWKTARARYVNLGIAEQNMMGVAAGLAFSGRVVYVNTMATFAATRALESVKLDIAFNCLPVRIVATHGGLSAGHLGSTHHSLEDLAVMRLLPNLTVLVPADARATEQLLRAAHQLPGPVYLRLGRNATPDLDPGLEPAEIGRAQRLRSGGDLTLIATGPYPVQAALTAGELLAAAGIGATVLNMHTVKPLDAEAVKAATTSGRGIVTVEEHWSAGGLGSAVAEVVSELAAPVPVRRVAVADRFALGSGGQQHLLQRNGITAEVVAERALQLVRGWAPVRHVPGVNCG